jgi:hypothetical protein
MGDPPVAFPASPFVIDKHHCGLMASDAVRLQDFFSVSGDLDVIRDSARVKHNSVL